MRSFFTLLSSLCLGIISSSAQVAPVLPTGFASEVFVTGLTEPVAVDIAPDGRWFITEKAGTVRIIENDVLLPAPFHSVTTQTPNERGLDGIVLDPDFDINGYVYLYYTLPNESKNVLARVTSAGNTALPASDTILFTFEEMWGGWHNGGAMLFDTTGKLIIGVGDGTAGGFGQSLSSTLAKIYRLNSDGSIPADNPLIGMTGGGIYDGIGAYGVRNPFTMAISPSTGRIFFNDVGNSLYEEINEYIPGKNYGWQTVEGPIGAGSPPPNYVDPIYSYDHTGGKCAVVGAAFYEPTTQLFPSIYLGQYFFMDLCEGKIYYMDPDTYVVTEFASGFGNSSTNLIVDEDGYLYVIYFSTGTIYKISYIGTNSPPFISSQPSTSTLSVGSNETLKVSAVGTGLNYQWFLNGSALIGEVADSLVLTNIQLAEDGDEYHVVVANAFGNVSSDTVALDVTSSTPPTINILSPLPGATYSAGDTIIFKATFSDMEDDSVPLTAVNWLINFHHDAHYHPAMTPTNGIDSGAYIVPLFGEIDTNVFYRIHVNAIDSSGLITNDFIDVQPNKFTIHLSAKPENLVMRVDGEDKTTNYDLRSVHNLNRSIDIGEWAIVGDSLYSFDQWWDGDDSLFTRTFSAGAEDTIHADYNTISRYYFGGGTGINITYYEGIGAGRTWFADGVVNQINENWDVQSPFPWGGFPNDSFTVKYSGYLTAPVTGNYTFTSLHDHSFTLNIGTDTIFKNVIAPGDYDTDTAMINLTGGVQYPFCLTYEHLDYVARIDLNWAVSVISTQLIPALQFDQNPASIPKYVSKGSLTLIPNPNNSNSLIFVTELSNAQGLSYELQIFDVYGRLQKEQSDLVGQNGQSSVDITALKPGTYFTVVRIGERYYSGRLVRY